MKKIQLVMYGTKKGLDKPHVKLVRIGFTEEEFNDQKEIYRAVERKDPTFEPHCFLYLDTIEGVNNKLNLPDGVYVLEGT